MKKQVLHENLIEVINKLNGFSDIEMNQDRLNEKAFDLISGKIEPEIFCLYCHGKSTEDIEDFEKAWNNSFKDLDTFQAMIAYLENDHYIEYFDQAYQGHFDDMIDFGKHCLKNIDGLSDYHINLIDMEQYVSQLEQDHESIDGYVFRDV